jgi:hypothetical protein
LEVTKIKDIVSKSHMIIVGVDMILSRLFLILFMSFALCSSSGYALNIEKAEVKYRKDRVLVQRKAQVSLQKMDDKHGAIGAYAIARYEEPAGLELVQLPSHIDVDSALKYYENDPNIEYAEPDYYYHALDAPNDPDFPKQWALNNLGQNSDVPHADINILAAWNLVKSSEDYVLGIIDTGVLYTHPDLAENMWTNPGEIPANNIDDDGNGYIDDVHGINAITRKGDPLDDQGHGTHVAGIIGARGDNGVGISGVNQRARIAACKFLDAMGSGSASDAITCLNYFGALRSRAVNPVKIILTSNSWGGGPFSQALLDAIKAHEQKGILFIAAAANDSRNNNEAEVYPANYSLSNIISVAATDNKDELAYFSNYGNQTVHVAAPGAKILSTYLGNSYKELSGTSMAAPHVSGLVGLVQAERPDLDYLGLRNLIIAGGQKLSSVQDKTISGRRIAAAGENGIGSLTCTNQEISKRLLPKETNMTLAVGNSVDFRFLHINCEQAAGAPLVSSEYDLNFDNKGGLYTAKFMPTQSGAYHFDFGTGDVVTVSVYNPSLWKPYHPVVDSSFQYRTITGTQLNLGDDTSEGITSPFPIHFAGDDGGLSVVQVGSNGILSLTDANISEWRNTTLPYKRVQTLIAPYWDDLIPGRNGGGVFYAVTGAAPHRELVVEYRNVAQFGGGKGGTFEVVFFEDSSDILFNYLNVDFSDAYGMGKHATVGIQISNTLASQFSYNSANIKNNMALRFVKAQ